MPNTCFKLFLALVAMIPVMPIPVLADKSSSDSGQFQLSAQMSDHAQLSRDEINSEALVKMAPSKVANPAISSSRLPAGYEQIGSPAAAKPAEMEEPGAFMKEKNVDWSHWVGGVADRWYYVLQQFEEAANVEFQTVRPALIQFTCYNNGQVGNVSLKQSSGNLIYDNLQMLALVHTVPLPAFPAGTMRTSITLVEGWESHEQRPGEHAYQPGSFGKGFPMEKVRQ